MARSTRGGFGQSSMKMVAKMLKIEGCQRMTTEQLMQKGVPFISNTHKCYNLARLEQIEEKAEEQKLASQAGAPTQATTLRRR